MFKDSVATLMGAIKKIRDYWEHEEGTTFWRWDDGEPKPPNPQRPSLTHTAQMERVNRRHYTEQWDGDFTSFNDLDPPSQGACVKVWRVDEGREKAWTVSMRKNSSMPYMPKGKVGIYRTVGQIDTLTLNGPTEQLKDLPRGAKRKLKELYPVMVLLLQDDV